MFLSKKMIFCSALVTMLCFLLGICFGSTYISPSAMLQLFGASPENEMLQNIILNIRLPRVLLGFLVGASLALAGTAFQGLLQNTLADPYTLGISSGASVGAVFVIFFGISIPILGSFTLPIVSVMMGICTLGIVLFFTHTVAKTFATESIILTGIIVSSFFSAFISLMISLSGEEMRELIMWLMGSVAMRGYEYVWLLLPFFIVGGGLLFINAHELNVFAFGEYTAQNVGVHVKRRKIMILIGASLLTGASVAVSGAISFVGLVIPHLVRLGVGANHRKVLPLAAMYGGSFLIVADLLARVVIAPRELPIGVVTALIGAPIFAYMLAKRKR